MERDTAHPPSKENPDGWVQLFHGYTVAVRRKFTFYHKAPRTYPGTHLIDLEKMKGYESVLEPISGSEPETL